MPAPAPDWLVPADYSVNMYDSLIAIVCRPGAGTVTDGLLSGARVFCFYEGDNREMANTAAALVEAGVGEDCKDVHSAYAAAISFATDARARDRHRAAASGLAVNGHVQAAELLASWAEDLQRPEA